MIPAQSYNQSFTSPPNWFPISASLCHYFHNIRGQICIEKIYQDRPACIDVDSIYQNAERKDRLVASPGSFLRLYTI